MIEILCSLQISERLVDVLRRAGRSESGGILMGEHVGPETFRIVDFTVDEKLGTIAYFLRSLSSVVRPLKEFFTKTKHQYERFNYLGEWHSHPSFELRPSTVDCRSMQELVEDPEVGAAFAVLLIVHLKDGELRGNPFAFYPGKNPEEATLRIEAISQ